MQGKNRFSEELIKKESIHYSGVTREWNSSIYNYNKQYIKSLIHKNFFVKYLLKCYLNMNFTSVVSSFPSFVVKGEEEEGEYKEVIKLKRVNNKRFSIKKIFSSNIYLKHTSNLVIITLFIFNKKNSILLNILKKLEFFSLRRKYLENKRKSLNKGNKRKSLNPKNIQHNMGDKGVILHNNKLLFNSIKEKIVLIKSSILPKQLHTDSEENNKGIKADNLRKFKLILKKNKNSLLPKNLSLKSLSLCLLRKKRLYSLIKIYNVIKLLINKDKSFYSYPYSTAFSPFFSQAKKRGEKVEQNNEKSNSMKKRLLHQLIFNLINPYSFSPIFLEGKNTGKRSKFISDFTSKFRGEKKRFLKNLISSLYYNQMFLFNKLKFTHLFMSFKGFGLISIIEKIFNGKKVQLNIISLKSLYLNSDILSESIASKLSDRKNKLLNILRKALRNVKLPLFHTCIQDKPLCLEYTKKNILNSIRYKTISGIRFEAGGRLTRRLIASRSIFKVRYIGNIKNIYSSYKYISSPILRGYIKSSLQYTLINSKTRNGSFGLKGWVNSY